MEKLELKHIVGYLPYGLKMIHNYKKARHNGEKKLRLWVMELSFMNAQIIVRDEDRKLILRPLSDLTKEIEVNGEKFVPIEWFEIGDDSNDSEEYDHGNIKLIKTLERISKFNISNDILYLPHGVVQKLYEWHFDIQGLIEKGFAIDINTLK